jgi:hypothetical protein
MNLAEWMGFTPGCEHDLELLPVVSASYGYKCIKCRGLISLPWTERIAAMNFDRLKKHAYEVLSCRERQEVPVTASQNKETRA